VLVFDRPRHRDVLRMPFDYARINQWPEHFTVRAEDQVTLTRRGAPSQHVRGAHLRAWPLQLKPDEEVCLSVVIEPAAQERRRMRYQPGSAVAAQAWQRDLRAQLAALLRVDDLARAVPPADVTRVRDETRDGVLRRELEFAATPMRNVRATWAEPAAGDGKLPAVVCIHGHGGTRGAVHDQDSIYRGFATALAQHGCVTLACDVGQHHVHEPGRTLMGERLWDLRRCVDVLCASPRVDPARIGCAGLSLGGELAMWLGALDERIAAVFCSGFLTTMDQMEEGHCPCWRVDGLRQLVDWADIYALIAPRPLLCENGMQEGPRDFAVNLARVALREITPIYRDLGAADKVALHVHGEGHVVDVHALLGFFAGAFGVPRGR
jgi:dienelactone hydrolase